MKKYSASLVFVAFLLIIALLFLVLPRKTYSENEKRLLSEFPELTWDSVIDGSFGEGLDAYLTDHFPLRDVFVGVHSYMELALGLNGNSGIYAAEDGYLVAAPGDLDEKRAETNLSYLSQFTESCGLPAALMVVPSAGYVLEDKLPAYHAPYWYEDFMELVEESKLPAIHLTEVFQEDPEGLYYRTDHHLTSLGSYRMYLQFCKAKGLEPGRFALAESYSGFYGTAYSKSGLWGTEPDVLEIWKPETPAEYQMTILDGGETTYDSLYFPEHLEKMDKYPVFLDGNHSLVRVENKSVQNGKKLLILKDSYAHCFTTFAISHYEEIVLVDMRYYRNSVQEVIDTYGITELLYLYGVENLATSTDLAWLLPIG